MRNLIEELKIQETFLFYKLRSKLKKPFDEAAIKQLFAQVSNQKIGGFVSKVTKEIETRTNKPVYYSLCIFKLSSSPSFLVGKTDLREEHLAYLLIVEYESYLAVSKKYIKDFDTLIYNYAYPLDTSILLQYRLESQASIEKLNMKSMDMSNDQIRERTIQANNVASTYAPINAEKNIVDKITVRNKRDVVQVSGTSSRVSFLGRRAQHIKYFNTVIDEINRLKRYKKAPNYLDHFAERIDFEKEIKKSEPIGILISAYELYDFFKTYETFDLYVKDSEDNLTAINFDNLAGILNYTFRVSPVTGSNEFTLTSTIEPTDPLLTTPEAEVLNNLSIEILKTKLAIRSRFLRSITVSLDGREQGSLSKLFDDEKILNAVFKPYGLVYRSGQLYRERDFSKRAEVALGILHPMVDLDTTTCEKFPGRGIPPNVANFDANSIFTWIENSHFATDADYLICDDLGNEWADYIAFKKNSFFKFMHAKNGALSLSASQFHDVVSQALKNIGNMRASAELDQKANNWTAPYGGRINKLRKFPAGVNAMSEFLENYKQALIETNVNFEAWLVVNFISKKQLEDEVAKLRAGGNIEPHVAQLISLLLRFVSGCQDAYVKPMVACLA